MMSLRDIVNELIAAAHQEWAGIAIMETHRFGPELDALAPRCIAAARKRMDAMIAAARALDPKADLTGLPRVVS
jgi:hypothetical protein